jgi:hypothetical protein
MKTQSQLTKIVKGISSDVGEGYVITGGHFLIEGGQPKELNEGTYISFKAALQLYKLAKSQNKKVGIGILLNDIGQVCGVDACSINQMKSAFSRNEFELPQRYKEILADEKVLEKEINIYWEKHMRNRGKKLFNKLKNSRKDITKKNGEYYLSDKKGYGDILLLRKMVMDKYGTPACPLIMAAYALEQEKRGFNASLNLYYIGNDNTSNIPNHIVIEKGKRVAEILGGKIDVKNIYMTADGVLKNY